MRVSRIVLLAAVFAACPLAFAHADDVSFKPIASARPIAPARPLAPSPLAPNAAGQVVIGEASLEYLIGLALRLAANDSAADLHMLQQMLSELRSLKSHLAALVRACEQQRALGKPCDNEAEIARAREAVANLEREVEARRRQSAVERAAQLASDLGRIEDDLRRALRGLQGAIDVLPAAPGKSVPRAALTAKTQQTVDKIVARRGELLAQGAKTTVDGGAPKK